MPRNYTRKTARKSRQPKLNTGAIRNGEANYCPLGLDWKNIERVYKPLPAAAKTKIHIVLKRYIGEDDTEHKAPFLKDAVQKINRLINSAEMLLKEQKAENEAERQVLSNIETRFGSRIKNVLIQYLLACQQIGKEMTDDSVRTGFEEGRAWRSMIWRLLDIVEEFDLPATVAKPSERSRRPSPFVALVAEIQKQLPAVHWSPPETPGALAAAIDKVRRKRRASTVRNRSSLLLGN